MSEKIICSKCGAIKKSDLCENGRILESKIYGAFIALHNKLIYKIYNYNHILVPLQSALQDLKLQRFSGNSNVMEIHKEIAKLKEPMCLPD